MAEITPVTREEYYLAKAGGQDVPVPSAVTREEYYLEKLSNDSVVVPSPVTRKEKFLYFACGGDIELPSEDRMTRLERLIAKAGGMDVSTPTAITRLEKFWANVEGGGWTVTTLTGTLPMTFRSNGTALINYKIYGTAEGAGVQTENEFDFSKQRIDNGFYNNTGGFISDSGWCGTNAITVNPNTEYTFIPHTSTGASAKHIFYDASDTMIGYQPSGQRTFITPADCVSMRFSYRATSTDIMLVKGSAVPDTFIPYGYKIPLTTSSGTESKTADIYIGDSKLEENDLIDFSGQKVFTNTVTTVFNGTENWQYYGIYGGHHTFYYDYGEPVRKQAIFLICNKYTSTFVSSSEETKNNTIRYQASITMWNINRVYIFDDRFDNAADFKENLERLYLANDPLVIIKQGENTIEITPPVPFPAIELFSGENALDSTETLGEVTITGMIKEAE